jgi:hypothetical protein
MSVVLFLSIKNRNLAGKGIIKAYNHLMLNSTENVMKIAAEASVLTY